MNMVTTRSLASLAFKLIGLYVLVDLIGEGGIIWSRIGASIAGAEVLMDAVIGVGGSVAYPCVLAALGFFLIRYAEGISERLVIKDEELNGLPFKNMRAVENVAYRCVGVVFVVRAFPQLVEVVVIKWLVQGHGTGAILVAGLFRRGVEILVGGLLVIRPRSVGRWMRNCQVSRFDGGGSVSGG